MPSPGSLSQPELCCAPRTQRFPCSPPPVSPCTNAQTPGQPEACRPCSPSSTNPPHTYFSFFLSSVWVSSSFVCIFSTRSSASLDALSSFFSRRLRRTLASLSSSPCSSRDQGAQALGVAPRKAPRGAWGEPAHKPSVLPPPQQAAAPWQQGRYLQEIRPGFGAASTTGSTAPGAQQPHCSSSPTGRGR